MWINISWTSFCHQYINYATKDKLRTDILFNLNYIYIHIHYESLFMIRCSDYIHIWYVYIVFSDGQSGITVVIMFILPVVNHLLLRKILPVVEMKHCCNGLVMNIFTSLLVTDVFILSEKYSKLLHEEKYINAFNNSLQELGCESKRRI